MSDLDTAALRALADSKLGTAPIGSVAEAAPDDDGDGVEWVALKGADGGYWWDVHGDDESLPTTDTIAGAGARLTKVPVGVEDLVALLDAADERDYLAADVERERSARIYANRIYGELSDKEIKARALLERALFGDRADDIDLPTEPLAELVRRVLGERDRARDAAAALEAEIAELRSLTGRTRKRVRGLIREGSSIGQVAGEVVGLAQEAAEDIDATLARTDPLRADA